MLEDLKPPAKVYPCKVREIAENLDAADSKIFMDAINDIGNWPNTMLAHELVKRGVYISEKPIRKHRRKECSCA